VTDTKTPDESSPAVPPPAKRPRPLVLCILDGFGERPEKEANAILQADAPHLATIRATYPRTLIGASGKDVGLPHGQMGNSEVGHLNFGAGRVALMDLSRIDVAVADGDLGRNEVLGKLVNLVRMRAGRGVDVLGNEYEKCRLHLFGLVSDGGVHSSLDHLRAIIELCAASDIQVVVHAFLDGRDTPPRSAQQYLELLEGFLDGGKRGVVGTIGGRYFAMDRDKRWDRVEKHLRAIVFGDGPREDSALAALEAAYAADKTDEFVEPTVIGDYAGMRGEIVSEFGGADKEWQWVGEEVGLCFNFRPDRMRQLCAMLIRKDLPPEADALWRVNGRKIRVFDEHTLDGLTEYDPKLGIRVAFPKEEVKRSFGEVIAAAGLKQFRCAETEKYAHVTYFFNGGREAAFEGEERKVVPSPRDVPTYDHKPEMSADAVTRSVVDAIASDSYDFVLVNFANPDMVGHTGVLEAATHAVEAVDRGLGAITEAALKKGGAVLITADHGNCETMVDEKGHPHTAHTTNPVPLYYVTERDEVALRDGGRLADVAPTMLEILGLPQPEEMTGRSLRVPRSG
jgi:2,3-bisphosphoglycerate-independent phosphoglycerate mutase